jgi:hypothetical protein
VVASRWVVQRDNRGQDFQYSFYSTFASPPKVKCHIYPSERDWWHKTRGVKVRVIDYRLEGIDDAEPIYRLVTSILEPAQADAAELAALYHERWEIETALDELKTHLRGGKIVLRSKTPDLVKQEFYGLILSTLRCAVSCMKPS